MKHFLLFLLSAVVFWACSKDDNQNTQPVPTVLFSYLGSKHLIINQYVSDLVPSRLDMSNFSITPSLPPGLSIDSQTGVISGAPIASMSMTNFLVKATSSEGLASCNLAITITIAAPTIIYGPDSYSLIQNVSEANIAPINSINNVTFSIVPQLPTGLSFNTATGAITGIPTVVSTDWYVVTATNEGGSSSLSLLIRIISDAGSRIKSTHTDYLSSTQYQHIDFTYSNGRISEKLEVNNTTAFKTEYMYDGNGQILLWKTASAGNPPGAGWGPTTTWVCTYTGDLISAVNNSALAYSYACTYNGLGQMTQWLTNMNGNTTTYDFQYHTDGNLYQRLQTYSGGETNFVTYPSYDNKNNPYRLSGFTTEYLAINAIPINNPTAMSNPIINEVYVYQYNSNNYPAKKTTYVNGVATKVTTYTYE